MRGCGNAADGPGYRPALLVIALSAFVGGFDTYVLNLALPTLRDAFRVDLAAVQWVVLAYLLAMVALLIPAGRLADALGPRAIFLAGLGLIAAGALLAATAPALGWLVAGRLAQGAGNAGVVAGGQAALALLFPGSRGRALGWLHAATSAGFLAGPVAGGFLIDAVGWRAIFLVHLPLAALALGVARRALPARAAGAATPIHLPGMLAFALGVGTLVLAFARLGGTGGVGAALGAGGIALACFAIFGVVERRSPLPLLDLALLRRRAVTSGLLAAGLVFVAMAANMFLVPFLLRDLLGLAPTAAGMVMATVPAAILLLAPHGGGLADRFGPRRPATLGAALVTAAIALLATVRPASPVWLVVGALALYGAGAALFQSPNNSAVLAAVPAGHLGAASGMLALARQLGQIVGIALASGVVRARWGGGEAAAFRDALLVLAVAGLLTCLVSWLREPVLPCRRPRRVAGQQGGAHD